MKHRIPQKGDQKQNVPRKAIKPRVDQNKFEQGDVQVASIVQVALVS